MAGDSILGEILEENRFDELFTIELWAEFEGGHTEHHEHFGNRCSRRIPPSLTGGAHVELDLSRLGYRGTVEGLLSDLDLLGVLQDYDILSERLKEKVEERVPGGILISGLRMDYSQPEADEERQVLGFSVDIFADAEPDPYSCAPHLYD